jgi:hypothetical protein
MVVKSTLAAVGTAPTRNDIERDACVGFVAEADAAARGAKERRNTEGGLVR